MLMAQILDWGLRAGLLAAAAAVAVLASFTMPGLMNGEAPAERGAPAASDQRRADAGRRVCDFRASLFGETRVVELN